MRQEPWIKADNSSESKIELNTNIMFGLVEEYLEANKDNFWDFFDLIKETIDNLDFLDYIQNDFISIIDRLKFIKKIIHLLSNLWELNITWISELKHLQKLALVWYINFLLWSLNKSNNTWYIVIPPWQWKTILSLLLANLDNRKTIILTDTNTNKSQFLKACEKISDLEGKYVDIDTQESNSWKVLIWWWASFLSAVEKWHIDLSKYSTIIIDEADVNWLSDRYQHKLKSYADKYWIKIIWLTATEEQVSRNLRDFYEYEVLRFSIPESLPELFKLWEVPNMTFSDVYIDSELILSKELWKNDSDIEDEDVDKFIKNSDWIEQIIDYHFVNNRWKKFILWMRNNTLNNFIIEKANSRWLNIESLDWTMSDKKREEVLKRLKEWKIDWIIWSRLIWRWLDIPECDLVYDSTITYSPQIFWQLKWRWFRLDIENENKHTRLVTFLPKSVIVKSDKISWESVDDIDDEWKKWKPYILPLCFEAFVNPEFFSKESLERRREWEINYNLWDLEAEEILSIKRVLSKLKTLKTYWNFIWKPELLTQIIRNFKGALTMSALINYLLKVKWNLVSKYFNESKRNIPTEEEEEFSRLMSIYMPKGIKDLTLQDERELLSEYFFSDDPEKKKKILDELLSYHYPIVISIAQNVSRASGFDVEDLIQSWIESVIKNIYNFKQWTRFSWYVAVYALSWITRYTSENQWVVNIPVHIWDIVRKVKWIIINSEKYLDTQEKLEIIREELSKKVTINIDLLSWIILNIVDGTNETFDEEVHSGDIVVYDNQEHKVSEIEAKIIIWKILLQNLSPKDERLVRMKYWIWNWQIREMTLDEIGQKMWVTRERIRQIIFKSLNKINKPWERRRLLVLAFENYKQ